MMRFRVFFCSKYMKGGGGYCFCITQFMKILCSKYCILLSCEMQQLLQVYLIKNSKYRYEH
jgi:hypothetical protein